MIKGGITDYGKEKDMCKMIHLNPNKYNPFLDLYHAKDYSIIL
jgi:hypothetical protein